MLGATRNAGERCAGQSISIHAPLCGGRRASWRAPRQKSDFNPRPPARGATFCERVSMDEYRISIHAPLRGGRPLLPDSSRMHRYFNPRPPARGATCIYVLDGGAIPFQSTPPCAGGDIGSIAKVRWGVDFNPRPPARGATNYLRKPITDFLISIHAPLRGGRHAVVTRV